MKPEKVEIKIKSKLGGSFLKGSKGKISFVSLARSINATIKYYQSNESADYQEYLEKIQQILSSTEEVILNLCGRVKQELDSHGITDDSNTGETCVIEFTLDQPIVAKMILMGMKCDELFSMLKICIKEDKIYIDRNYLSQNYQKPAIDSLKKCLDEILIIEKESRRNRKGGLYN